MKLLTESPVDIQSQENPDTGRLLVMTRGLMWECSLCKLEFMQDFRLRAPHDMNYQEIHCRRCGKSTLFLFEHDADVDTGKMSFTVKEVRDQREGDLTKLSRVAFLRMGE